MLFRSERISRILKGSGNVSAKNQNTKLLDTLEKAETEFFSDPVTRWSWTDEMLEKAFIDKGFAVKTTVLERQEERLITGKDLDKWFDSDNSAWGKAMESALGKGFTELRELLLEQIQQGSVLWRWKSILFKTTRS